MKPSFLGFPLMISIKFPGRLLGVQVGEEVQVLQDRTCLRFPAITKKNILEAPMGRLLGLCVDVLGQSIALE